MNIKAQQDIERKLQVLRDAERRGNVKETCRAFGISREIFYRWRRAYAQGGEQALVNSGRSPSPVKPRIQLPVHIEEEILDLRQTCQFGIARICRELQNHHGFRLSLRAVRGVLRRHNMPISLPQDQRMRVVVRPH